MSCSDRLPGRLSQPSETTRSTERCQTVGRHRQRLVNCAFLTEQTIFIPSLKGTKREMLLRWPVAALNGFLFVGLFIYSFSVGIAFLSAGGRGGH